MRIAIYIFARSARPSQHNKMRRASGNNKAAAFFLQSICLNNGCTCIVPQYIVVVNFAFGDNLLLRVESATFSHLRPHPHTIAAPPPQKNRPKILAFFRPLCYYNVVSFFKSRTIRTQISVPVVELDTIKASDFPRLRGQFPKKLLYIVGVNNYLGNKTTMHKKFTPEFTPQRIAYKLSAKTICACSLIG